ncbi:phosphotransferase enzyme family protein [Vibrio nitrifigilis]|uniref:Phosphotransferase n=1 Tax=Vibrio nitrifigilis TaxID=2789781 RepID=A0ABS0GJC0_9VIBR|nr:phosphotransferase [Vibrio nitrifigilis]MBF9002550.1 phosphotransferase [Vibrio nitrifigilis]
MLTEQKSPLKPHEINEAEQYDTLTDEQVIALAQIVINRYGPDQQGEISLLCRSENATLKVQTDTTQYALRIHRPNYHDKQDIQSELHWLNALQECGMVVPNAVADANGILVQEVQVDTNETRYAVLFEWIAGEEPTTDVDPKAFEELGRIMARLHRQAIHWQRPTEFKRIVWDHESMVGNRGHWGRWYAVEGLTAQDIPIVNRVLEDVAQKLKFYGKAPDRYGLIHADLRLTNLLLHPDGTRVIDFDDCGLGWFMHDAAATVSFFEHHPNMAQWMDAWLTGYQSIRPLTTHDINILPVMIIQRRIQLMAWVGSHQQTDMAQSLGSHWVRETMRLCEEYLADQTQLLRKAG